MLEKMSDIPKNSIITVYQKISKKIGVIAPFVLCFWGLRISDCIL